MVATILEPTRDYIPPIDMDPKSTYEVVTREKVERFADELKEIRYRVNGIFYLVIGGLLMDVLLRLIP